MMNELLHDAIVLHALNAFSFFAILGVIFFFAPYVNRFLGLEEDE